MPRTDPTRLLELFERDRAALTLYAKNWVGEAFAADVVQDAFIKLFESEAPPLDARAWLFRVTRNAAISAGRSAARRRRTERGAALTKEAFAPSAAALVDRDAVASVLASLSDSEREIVILRIWAEMSLDDISGITSMSIPTVHRTYQRSLAAIKAALEATCRTNRK